ncbi:hypothetical protein [Roseomonas populi]|uniref:Lipoprotein n=1 Tax=Roseomonas populi TaxID=3121582 RepID=A0ABT1X0S3_9PROT|nr:hypothetical protein [Roseomonas pecuniae]MCR0981705.1 hypothetical protein [Roseomonas pecuniae]
MALLVLSGCVAAPSSKPEAAAPVQAAGASDPARVAARNEVSAAMGRKDHRQAIRLIDDWMRGHPDDISFRYLEPLLYRLAGDGAGWERSRAEIQQSWQRLRDTVPPPTPPAFVIDAFPHGQDLVSVHQCYETAGRFGVMYEFLIVARDNRLTSYFTVEHSSIGNQIMRELGQQEPVYSVDYFRPGMHATVAMLNREPTYEEARQRVLAFLADPKPLSASTIGRPGLASVHCEVARRASRG